jgi:hypothetical protein
MLKIHNLNKPVSEKVWYLLEGISWSNSERDTLNSHQNYLAMSGRELLELARKEAFETLSTAYSLELSFLCRDTSEYKLDSLLNTIDSSPLVNSKCLRIASMISNGLAISANEIYTMHGGVSKTDEDCKLYALQTALPDSLRDWRSFYFNSDFKTQLENLANSSDKAVRAQALLEYLNHQFSEGVYYLPSATGNKEQEPVEQSEITIAINEGNGSILIFPNPANEFISIKLRGVNGNANFYTASIIDDTGRIIAFSDLKKEEQKIQTSSYTSGIYTLIIYENAIPLAIQKFVITH